MNHQSIILSIILVSIICVYGCADGNNYTPVKIERFDKDLIISLDSSSDKVSKDLFINKYSDLINIYCNRVLRCSTANDTVNDPLGNISIIYKNGDFRKLYDDTEKEFKELSETENELTIGFGRYSEIFPDKTIPVIYSHVSGFAQSVITSDSLISIALDNYLGEDYAGYKGVFYDYQLKDRSKSRIAPDVMRAWLYTEFPDKRENKTLADRMIYEGAVLYTLQKLLPDRTVFDLLNYNNDRIKWSKENEKNIWQFILKSNHLYSTDAVVSAKYINNAPYNMFLGKEAPGELGRWIGYKIVSGYIDNTNDGELRKLLSDPGNTIEILKKSGY